MFAVLAVQLPGNPYGAYGVVVGGYGPTSIITSLDRVSPYGVPGNVCAGHASL